ncbi:16755_t:CDS:2 [Acaulospora colombiana]|uniref:16755_t:CDS:1 n=1 Tax=Acaulospora colombiana TaxID=27376 RepID=A0ACA9K9T9_9GLOM|nr:16755_t:CDS:2 [Acaulospora colombiana]
MAEQLIAKYFKKAPNVTTGSSEPPGISPSVTATSTHTSNITKNPKKKRNKMIETMKLKSKARNWAIGKVLDKISAEGKIRNMNNQLLSDDPERLILFNTESGDILSTERRLCESVESGDSVGLEKLGNMRVEM